MLNHKWAASLVLFYFAGATWMHAQAKPEPDVLIFTDGEKLIGHLKSAKGTSVVFKSDMAGEVTVDWGKIQELRTSGKFAVIRKGVELRKSENLSQIPQGTVEMTNQKVQVAPAPPAAPATVPVADISNVVEEASFEKAFHRTPFLQGWKGGITAGISLTEATQTSETFNGAINLVRLVPGETWIDARSRTIFDFNESYGEVSQSGLPTIKTSVTHMDAEEDWYLSPRFYALAEAALDHNASQGLLLQQSYGAGIGAVVLKRANQELDVKVSANFIDQSFNNSTLNEQLFGTVFGETYVHKFAHGILFNEQGSFTPAWNDTTAYSAFASAGLTFPVYHRLGLTLGAVDTYLNNPPPTFKKNSVQFTLGATYAFQ